MNIQIVIPAYNEAEYIAQTLLSLTKQSLQPTKIIVVDDSSTDETAAIVRDLSTKYAFIHLVTTTGNSHHRPGSKVVNAFYKGYAQVDNKVDLICKFDADLIFPVDYLERVTYLFSQDSKVGIASGILHVQDNDQWIYENVADKNHVRGPIKAYRRACFESIGGLRASIGWDTVDVLLANYHNWTVQTDTHLIVKHLKPTGHLYDSNSRKIQGEAMYKMRYGLLITLIAICKIATRKKHFRLVANYLSGYFKAKKQNLPYIVSEEEGRFIRKLRWRGIWRKLKAYG